MPLAMKKLFPFYCFTPAKILIVTTGCTATIVFAVTTNSTFLLMILYRIMSIRTFNVLMPMKIGIYGIELKLIIIDIHHWFQVFILE
jgi:hypothetical protein